MSDNNFPCGKCGGSGGIVDNGIDECHAGLTVICPSCSKGNVQLAVECVTCGGSAEYCSIKNSPKCPCIEDGDLECDSCSYWIPCPDCTNGYRPLTDDEVDELERFEYHLWMLKHGKVVGAKWDSFYWNKVDSGEMYFKGSQVTLIPID